MRAGERDREIRWCGRAARLFCLLAGGVGLWLALRRGLPLIAPFLLSWLLSRPIRSGAYRLERHLRLPRRVGVSVLLPLASVVPIALIAWLTGHLVDEAQQLLQALGGGERVLEMLERAAAVVGSLAERLPLSGLGRRISDQLRGQLDAAVASMAEQAISRLSAAVSSWVSLVVGRAPVTLASAIAFLLSLAYWSFDDGRMAAVLASQLPAAGQERLRHFAHLLQGVCGAYLRTCVTLMLVTFAGLLVGFSVLGVPCRLLLALLISLLDALPLLGVGTVLLPWGLLSLLCGNHRLGVGLLLLCGVLLLLRQLLEPRLLGSSLGLHPLAALAAVFVGLRVGGVVGMIAAPALTVVAWRLWRETRESAPLNERSPKD